MPTKLLPMFVRHTVKSVRGVLPLSARSVGLWFKIVYDMPRRFRNRVTFDFHARQGDEGSKLGRLTFCDPDAGICITNAAIRHLQIPANRAAFSGSGHLEDGTKITFSVTVTDNGPTGTSDFFAIDLSNGYSASGNPTRGDIQICGGRSL